MSTLTIHALEPEVERRIRAKATREGRSLNRTLKELLAESVGVRPACGDNTDHRADFAEFQGVWNAQDVQEFEEATADLSKVDQADWEK